MGQLRQAVRRVCTALLPRSWMLFHGAVDCGAVALTFDDGPHPEHTPLLLDELDRQGIRATFFVIGELARQRPDLVKRIVAEGHSLGHHTWTHSHPDSVSSTMLVEEVRRTRDFLECLTGRVCHLFRPPRGQLTAAKTLRLWANWQSIVLWNVDSEDCRVESGELALVWARAYRPASGDVVLLHDDYSFVRDLIEPLAHVVRSRGLDFATLDDWIPVRRTQEPIPATVRN